MIISGSGKQAGSGQTVADNTDAVETYEAQEDHNMSKYAELTLS